MRKNETERTENILDKVVRLMAKVTIQQLQKMKEAGEKISMVTAYDYSQAVLVEKAGIEVVLVGDSLAMTTLGHEGTTALTTDEMIAHIKPVVKGAPSPLVIGDLVFGSYNESLSQAVHSSTRLIKEGGCDAVKLEGAHPNVIRAIVDGGIAVQGHLGLTPQTAVLLGDSRSRVRARRLGSGCSTMPRGWRRRGFSPSCWNASPKSWEG